jgi:hypothetical protein
MAEQQLNIKLNVIDNASQAFKSVKDTIFNLRTALLGIGAGSVVKSILNVGSQAQQLRNQFLLLAPSIEEGKKAFEELQKFTAQSPLQSDSIERASEIVFAFSKNSKELTDNLFAIQNAAITLGLDIETVAREFSSLSRTGIEGARELKRRNIESFLGLQEGVKLSSQEITRIFLQTFGRGGTFESASDAFANTFAGATNRFRNSLKQVQESISQAGLLDFFTDLVNVFSDLIRNNPEQLGKFVKEFTFGLIEGIKAFASFTSSLIELLKEPFNVLVMSIKGVNDLLNLFPEAVKEIGIVGFFLLGKKGKAVALAIGFIIKAVEDALISLGIKSNDVTNSYESQKDNLILQFDLYKALEEKSKSRANAEKRNEENIQKAKNNVAETLSIYKKLLSTLSQLNDNTLKQLDSVATFANIANQGITDFSRSIAEIIVLGKSLSGTFKEFLQGVLVKILASTIEYLVRLYIIQPLLDKILGTERDRTQEQSKQTTQLLQNLGINYLDLEVHKQKIEAMREQNGLLQSQLVLENGIAGARAAQSSYGGGGGGGGGSDIFGSILSIGKSIFGAEGGSMSAGQPYTVGERGRELFIPETNGTLIPNHDMMGGTNINFTINATDVKGVKELLLNNRATITNIVNQALNAKGKSNLI